MPVKEALPRLSMVIDPASIRRLGPGAVERFKLKMSAPPVMVSAWATSMSISPAGPELAMDSASMVVVSLGAPESSRVNELAFTVILPPGPDVNVSIRPPFSTLTAPVASMSSEPALPVIAELE